MNQHSERSDFQEYFAVAGTTVRRRAWFCGVHAP
jgi:hypothetical protein